MRWRRILCVVAICFVFTGSLSSAPSAHNFLAANKYGTWKWFSTHHPPDLEGGSLELHDKHTLMMGTWTDR
jgi:hypothetical protein